jgi:hypothetical protein
MASNAEAHHIGGGVNNDNPVELRRWTVADNETRFRAICQLFRMVVHFVHKTGYTEWNKLFV